MHSPRLTQAVLANPNQAFNDALDHHEAGRLAEAESIYLQLLEINPSDAEVFYLLGTVAYHGGQHPRARHLVNRSLALGSDDPEALHLAGTLANAEGDYSQAIELFSRVLSRAPAAIRAHCSLGEALQAIGRIDEAVTSFRNAVALNPTDPQLHNQLGTALYLQRNLEAAIASYRQAVDLAPNEITVHNNLGIILLEQNNLTDALQAFEQVIRLNPAHAPALNDLGTIFKLRKDATKAADYYRRAIEADRRFAAAHSNLGTILKLQGHAEEALSHYREACSLEPVNAMYLNNLALALQELKRYDESIACYKKALTLQPDAAEIHCNLGVVLKEQGLLQEAIARYRLAIALKPDFTLAYSNLGNVLLEQGNIDEAIDTHEQGLIFSPNDNDANSNLLLAKHYQPNYPLNDLIADHRRFGERLKASQPYSSSSTTRQNIRKDILKIGFVSGDFCEHPVGYFLEKILAAFDRKRFDITLYMTQFRNDELTQRLRQLDLRWQPLMGLADIQAAEQIQSDNIDILIDLSGHTAHNRLPLFALKPAPVQITWLGYWATTGLEAIDYILCDPYSTLVQESEYFSEKLWFLPETRLCFTPPSHAPEVSLLPALTNNIVTFGCFNNLAKINEEVIALWANILARTDNSRLFLKARQLYEPSAREHMAARFASYGIAPERLLLEGPSSREDYLRAYNRVDIALDPFPFTGGTTSLEGLWMGVPFLTRQGDRMLSRQGESILHNLGLSDWIAKDSDDYAARVSALVTDLHSLAELRSELRSRLMRSPLCDAQRFARHLESAFFAMWDKTIEEKK